MRLLAAGLMLLVAGRAGARPDPIPPYTSEAGRFRATFPAPPKTETKRVVTPAGSLSITTSSAEAARDVGVYLAVTFTDYPEAFQEVAAGKLLDGVRDGLRGLDGKVTRDTPIAAGPDDPQGRDITVVAGDNVVRCRAVLVGRRLYQVTAAGKAGAVGSAPVEDFFRSFELLK